MAPRTPSQDPTDPTQPTHRRVVLADVHNYKVPTGNPMRPFDIATGRRGETIEITQSELDRIEKLDQEHPHPRGKRLGSVEDYEETVARESEVSPLDEIQYRGMSLEEVGAYLNQHPEQAEHVLLLEEAQEEPRQQFLDLAQNMASAHEEQVRAQQAATQNA